MSRFSQLAINDEGFVFDPSTGESFTVTQTGLVILKGLKEERDNQELSKLLTEEYEVSTQEAERDVIDFIQRLRTYNLM